MTGKGLLTGTVSCGVLVALWAGAARITGSFFILPSPYQVFRDSIVLVRDPSFFLMLAATCSRGLAAFAISLILSFLLGFPAGMSDSFSAALRPWMTIIKATPVVSFILIAILWFGSSFVPVFVSVLMTLPVLTEAIAQGVRSSDSKLLEMSKAYHFRKLDVLLHIQLPSALPFFIGGAGASLGLTWKVVVAGEILSIPHIGIGSSLQTAKVHLETARVFSLTLSAIALSILTELLFEFLMHLSRRHAGQEGRP